VTEQSQTVSGERESKGGGERDRAITKREGERQWQRGGGSVTERARERDAEGWGERDSARAKKASQKHRK